MIPAIHLHADQMQIVSKEFVHVCPNIKVILTLDVDQNV